jgi:hypothetical protein
MLEVADLRGVKEVVWTPSFTYLTTTVARDVLQLIHATQFQTAPAVIEKDPPNWRWRLPLGFVTLAAAASLLIAAGGVHFRVQEQKHGARYHKTMLHKQRVRAQVARPRS